jgi:hypothetical protein
MTCPAPAAPTTQQKAPSAPIRALRRLSFATLAFLGRTKPGEEAPVVAPTRSTDSKAAATVPTAARLTPRTSPLGVARPTPVGLTGDVRDVIRAAILDERKRCAAIVAHGARLGHDALGRNLAFVTGMPRADAIALLDATPAQAVDGIVPGIVRRHTTKMPEARHGAMNPRLAEDIARAKRAAGVK